MPGEDESRVHTVKSRERRECQLVVGVEVRKELRPDPAVDHVARDEGIPDADHIALDEEERGASLRVARNVDDAGRAGDIEDRAVAERRDLEDRRRAQPVAQAEDEETT